MQIAGQKPMTEVPPCDGCPAEEATHMVFALGGVWFGCASCTEDPELAEGPGELIYEIVRSS